MFCDVKYIIVFMLLLPEMTIFAQFFLDFHRGSNVEGHMDVVRGHKMAS